MNKLSSGLLYALAACFIWGLIYVVPLYMPGFSSLEVALGRYVCYGLISAFIFMRSGIKAPLKIWKRALLVSLTSTFVFYTCLILSLRFSAPAVSALILGISPVAIAYYGNMRKKECRFRSLIIPSLLILFGLILINVPYISMSSSITEFLFGIFCALVSLSAWSWYVVDNAHFLSQNPDLKSGDWATMIGVTTLVWVAIMSVVCSPAIEFSKFWTPGQPLLHFIIGSLILGSLCSWLGAYLWNIASLRIPVTLAGQMTIFESIFGLLFIYSINRHTPPPLECLGIAFLLGAILYGINSKKVPVLE